MIDPELLTTTFDVYRPFGAGSPLSTANPCRIVPDVPCGRGSGLAGLLAWTHYIDCQPGVSVEDQCTRPPGSDAVLFADGDKVVCPGGGSTPSYCVVFVVVMNEGTTDDFQRVFLIRDTA